MPEAAAVWLVEAAEAAYYGEMVLTASQVAMAATALQVVGSVYVLRDQQRRAENRARDSYNASLRDRYVMTRGATEQRQLVLGRQRVSGPVGFIRSYGTNNTKLVFTVILAAHEIDAVEEVFFDDERVTLDGSGNVTGISRHEQFSISAATGSFTLQTTPAAGTVTATAYYGTTTTSLTVTSVSGTTVNVSGANPSATGLVVVAYRPDPNPYAPTKTTSRLEQFSPAAGTHTVTLAYLPVASSVAAIETVGEGLDRISTPLSVTVSGSDVTFTSGGSPVDITYQSTESASLARVRVHLGGAGQTADSAMVSNLSGVWTSAHKGTGLAYLVVELDYDETAFPNGIPNVSAIVRGAKVYDPRTSTTAWSENPALLARAYAIHALGGRLDASLVDDTAIIAAANVCDTSTNYVVGGQTYTRARYTAGITARTGSRPQDVLNDLTQAMGGRWALTDGKLRIVAGAYTAPVLSLDESWLSDGGPVNIQPTRNRADTINTAIGTFADASRNYLVTQYPKVIASAYVTADGAELPADLNYAAVTFSGQAQYLSASQLRYARQGLTVKLTCNLKAYQAEVFDVINVSLARFGWTNKTFEVLDTSWTLDGGIELTLKEVDSSIWALDAAFSATDPAPNTRLPAPWTLPAVTSLTLTSGTSTLLRMSDGTIVPRILATWSAQVDPRITQQGNIELRWGESGTAEAGWFSTVVAGSATSTYLDSVKEGVVYVVKARTVGAVTVGDWCVQKAHQVVGKAQAPANVSGLSATNQNGNVLINWTASGEVDYDHTELRRGASWAAGTLIARISGTAFLWPYASTPGAGTYTIWAAHYDTSGNASTTPAYTTVTVTTPTTDWGSISGTGRPQDNATNGANLLLKSSFEDGSAGTWVNAVIVSVSGQTWTKALQTNYRDSLENNYVPVKPGDVLYAAADLDASTSNHPVAFGIEFSDSSKTGFDWRYAGGSAIAAGTSGWQRVAGAITAPANAAYARGWAHMAGFSGFGTARFANLYVGRQDLGANSTYISGDAIYGVASGSGTNVRNGAITLTSAGALQGAGGGTISLGSVAGSLVPAQLPAIIDATKFASGVEPVTIVTGVPGSKSTNTIYDTTTAKLYRWNGSAYVAAVPSTDITGTLSDSQLAAISAAKVTGTLVASQLAVQIGGGNLLPNAAFKNTAQNPGLIPDGWTVYNNGGISYTIGVSSGGGLFGTNFVRITSSASTTQTLGVYTRAGTTDSGSVTGGVVSWVPGQTYVISFWARAAGSLAAGFHMQGLNSNMNWTSSTQLENPALINGTWQRYSWRVSPADNANTPAGELYISWDCVGTLPSGAAIDICAPQVEYGEIATAFAPRVSEILPSTISATEIADNAVTTPKLVAGAVVAGKIAANAISATEIQSGAITTAKLAAGAVTANEIAANTITAAKIAAGTITATEIASGAITTAKLAAGAVTANEIAANTITSGKIAAGAISTTELAANAVTTAKLAAGSVTATEIASGTITADRMVTGLLSSDNVLTRGLTVRDNSGNVIFGVGTNLDWSRISSQPSGIYNSNITVTLGSNGAISASGGPSASGAVTFSGLGTTGAVGSGNLAANGDFLLSTSGVPTHFLNYNNAGVTVTNTINSGGPIQNSNYWRINVGSTGSTTFGWHFYTAASCFGGWKANTNYIVSFYARCSAYAGATFGNTWNQSPAVSTALQNPGLSTSWQRYVWLINFGNNAIDSNGFWTISEENLAVGTNLDFACIQVEQGDAPSGWAPAPVSSLNQITSTNISTYIASAAISWAYIGNLDISTAGAIKSGKTSYSDDSNSGWWIGMDSTTPKFKFGNSTQYIRWTGSALEIGGQVVTNSNLAGSISADKLSLGTITVSFSPSSVTATVYSAEEQSYTSVTASASGGASPYTYRFALESYVADYTSGSRPYVNIYDVDGGTVTLRGAQPLDSQQTVDLICVVTDANGRTGTGVCGFQITYGDPP